MNKEELNERRTHVRRLIAEVNNARMRDLRNEKIRHNAQLRDVYDLHALNVGKIEEEYQARMIDLRAERDMLSQEVPDDGGENRTILPPREKRAELNIRVRSYGAAKDAGHTNGRWYARSEAYGTERSDGDE